MQTNQGAKEAAKGFQRWYVDDEWGRGRGAVAGSQRLELDWSRARLRTFRSQEVLMSVDPRRVGRDCDGCSRLQQARGWGQGRLELAALTIRWDYDQAGWRWCSWVYVDGVLMAVHTCRKSHSSEGDKRLLQFRCDKVILSIALTSSTVRFQVLMRMNAHRYWSPSLSMSNGMPANTILAGCNGFFQWKMSVTFSWADPWNVFSRNTTVCARLASCSTYSLQHSLPPVRLSFHRFAAVTKSLIFIFQLNSFQSFDCVVLKFFYIRFTFFSPIFCYRLLSDLMQFWDFKFQSAMHSLTLFSSLLCHQIAACLYIFK